MSTMKPTIPENLLTTEAIYGLMWANVGFGNTQFPDAAVLDDWLKEHDIDVRVLWTSRSYGPTSDTVQNWFHKLRNDAQTGRSLTDTHFMFLRLLEEYLPEYRSSWRADPNEPQTDSDWP